MKYRKNVWQSLVMVTQFGINMIVPILLCTVIGVYIGKKYDMLFIALPLFFIGALAGFRNVYVARCYRRQAFGLRKRSCCIPQGFGLG